MRTRINKPVELPYPYNLLAAIYESEEMGETVLDEDQTKGLAYALGTLSDREREIIRQRYEELLTFEETAKEWRVTRERIRQIEVRALRKMRHPSRLRYIEKGYSIASGELEERVRQRHERELARLESQYEQMVSETTKKLLGHELPSDHVLSRDINTLDLSVRTYNVMKRAGVTTIAQFISVTDKDLMMMRNVGAKTIAETHHVQDKIRKGYYG